MSKPGRTISNKCPHCGESLWIRSSEQVDPLLKRLYGQCTNLHCGFTAQGFLTWDAELSPSAMPNPNIHLPKSAAKQNKTGTHPSAMPSETERKAKASASDYSNRSKNNWCLPVLSRSPDSEHQRRTLSHDVCV